MDLGTYQKILIAALSLKPIEPLHIGNLSEKRLPRATAMCTLSIRSLFFFALINPRLLHRASARSESQRERRWPGDLHVPWGALPAASPPLQQRCRGRNALGGSQYESDLPQVICPVI